MINCSLFNCYLFNFFKYIFIVINWYIFYIFVLKKLDVFNLFSSRMFKFIKPVPGSL